jgi:hypothetical protein
MMKTRGLRRNRRLAKIVLFASLFPFYLLFASCDVFTGPKVNLYQQISDEVDWATAPKLTVTVAFPQAWGTSNPQQGVITPAKDIRKGHAFEIEFTPDTAWSLDEWRAYRSPLPEGWLTDLALLDGLKRLDGEAAGKLVEVPTLPARGGTGSFKINTTDAVTLVPWCKSEPYVIRTSPRNSPSTTLYPRVTDIVIYFNAPLVLPSDVELPDLFESETIKITAGGNKVSADNSCYNYPVYKSSADTGEYTITMSATSNVPGDSVIEVTVGPGIYNAAGTPMSKAEVFSFSTSPGNADGGIGTWNASYNGNSITVNWTTNGSVIVEARYRVNQGGDNSLSGGSPGTIYGVNPADDSGVREGRGVSGIVEYEVFLDLYIEGIKSNMGSVSFKIWNIPGMSVAHNNLLKEIDTAEELAAIALGLGGQYVLANDIDISDTWTPLGSASFLCTPDDYNGIYEIEIGDGSEAFKGKLYGNGHKISINSDLNTGDGGDAVFTGLFGVALGAEIRDLGFACNVSLSGVSADGDFVAGGLVAYAKDTVIRNVVTTGVLAVGVSSGEGVVRIGGIAGYFEGTDKIENCRASLSAKYTSSGHIGLAYIGAIAGETGEGDVTLDRLLLNGVTVAADVAADKASNIGYLSIGGAVGISGQNTMKDIIFTAGTVSFYRGIWDYGTVSHYIINCGGLVGSSGSNMVECSFLGKICTISEPPTYTGAHGSIYCGGLVGSGGGYYNNCRVRADINLSAKRNLYAGGVFGRGSGTITNCFFEDGNINISTPDDAVSDDIYIGGFTAESLNSVLNNCGTMAGTITVSSKKSVRLGGFIRINEGNVSNCFSRINIIVDVTADSVVGGFIGTNNGTVKSCYATGTIYALSGTIGGLVGENTGTISHCYALGNVIADSDRTSATVTRIGGLAGSHGFGSNSKIENCFSAGRVSAAQNGTSSSQSYSGGIVGYMSNSSTQFGNVKNTVALGASVTAKGNVRDTGRIYGYAASSPSSSYINNNYAFVTMTVEQGAYASNTPTSQSVTSSLTSRDGMTTAASVFYDQSFWTNIGFTVANGWNYGYIARDGHPRLAWEQ